MSTGALSRSERIARLNDRARQAMGVACVAVATEGFRALSEADQSRVRELVETLHTRGPGLSAVLARCSYLCDGVAVRDLQTALGDTQTVDVLPPFAGG